MSINDLWLVQDSDGYWRTGYELSSDDIDSPFFNCLHPSFAFFGTILLFKFLTSAELHGSYHYMRENTAVRYADLGED